MSGSFIHLNTHSEYSISESIIRIDDLLQHAVESEVPAVAITDTGNLFASVKFYGNALKRGIKPIIGCELRVGYAQRQYAALFLCCNNAGHANLMQLVSKACTHERSLKTPVVEYEWLAEHSDGLIALSSAAQGDVGAHLLAGDEEAAVKQARFWASVFKDRYYIELQNIGRDYDIAHLSRAIPLANREGLPVVATNRVCFLRADDFRAHETRVCIARSDQLDDPNRAHLHTEMQYFKSGDEMKALFNKCPEAIENTIEIAKRCTVEMTLGRTLLPVFPIAENRDPNDHLKAMAQERLEEFLRSPTAKKCEASPEVYRDRLTHELKVISDMGYAGYFLIVADFVGWARKNDIPVGPGRGSGAGSLIAYLIGITQIDPVRYNLVFERFLNPERVSMPDFDIDFCTEGRDDVIRYVSEFYGSDKVSQIITFGTMAARAVVRDVGRVLGCPYSMMDKIAKLIPMRLDIKLSEALRESKELETAYKQDDKVHEIIDLSLELEGLTRNVGCHAGGVVISPKPLTHYSALYRDANSNLLTQLDMNDLETVGLVKFDFLGLRTLTVLDKAVKSIRESGQELPALTELALDDEETYRLLQAGRTSAVFQLESEGIRRLLQEFKPDRFSDLVAILAIYRPGPLQSGMVKDFIQRKNGAKFAYPHPKLQAVLKPTYGVIVYQEQVMEIAQILAGYTMGEADMLRRAMGKKKPDEMAKHKAVFVDNAVKRGVERRNAADIFSLMEKFAGYGFNKSHSVAYALVSYQTAWLKTRHSAFFMAATMSTDMDSIDKIDALIHECRSLNIQVERPDINQSEWDFTARDATHIRYGLGAIPTLGRQVVETIVNERKEHGEYASLDDFCARLVAQEVRKNAIETLVRTGSFDALGERAATLARLPVVYAMAEQNWKNKASGQNALFSGESSSSSVVAEVSVDAMKTGDLLKMEKDALGLYIGRHPLDDMRAEMRALKLIPLRDLMRIEGNGKDAHLIAGVIIGIKQRQGRKGAAALFTIDDGSGRLELLLGGKAYDSCKDMLVHDQIVVIEAYIHYDNFRERRNWRVRNILSMDDLRRSRGQRLRIRLDADATKADFCARLGSELNDFRSNGHCPIDIEFHRVGLRAQLTLGERWRVSVCDEVLERLRRIEGVEQVKVEY